MFILNSVIVKITFMLYKDVCARIEKQNRCFYCVELSKIKFHALRLFTATVSVYQNPALCPKGVLLFYFVVLLIASKSFSRCITCHHLPQGGDVTAGGCLSANGYISLSFS